MSALNSNVDIAPTLLTSTGMDIPKSMPGHDLRSPEANRKYVFSQMGRSYMVRTKDRKLYLATPGESHRFFDLATDPLEMTDLYEDPAVQDEIAEMRGALLQWFAWEAPARDYRDLEAPQVAHPTTPDREQVRAHERRHMQRHFGHGQTAGS